MIDITRLYYGHLKNTKKIIFISTIGLICAITIVSSSFIYIDATKGQIVSDLKSGSDSSFDLQMNYYYIHPGENIQSLDKELRNMTSNLIKQSNLDIFNNLELFYSATGGYTVGNGFNGNKGFLNEIGISVIQLNSGIRKDLSGFLNNNSHLPSSNSSKLEAFELQTLFTSKNSPYELYYKTHDFVNASSNLKVYYYSNIPFESQVLNFNITGRGKIISEGIPIGNGKIIPNYLESSYPTLSKIWKGLALSRVYLFVNNLTYFLNQMRPNYIYKGFNFRFLGGLNIDLSKIDAFSVASRYKEIQNFINNYITQFYNTNFAKNAEPNQSIFVFYFQTQGVFFKIASATNTIFYDMLLYAIPILIIALFLSNFSFGLIHRKVIRHIGIYKTRGASPIFILLFEFFDFILIILLSTFAGLLAGLPIASVVSKTDFLLSFDNPRNYDVLGSFIANFNSLSVILLIFGVIIGMIVNLRRTFHLANMSIVDTENPSAEVDPYWKRHYLDVLLFLYGVVSYIVLFYITHDQNGGLIASSFIITFLYLSLPSPFALVVGTIFLVNRLTPLILNWIGTKLWHRRGGLLAFSFKNVLRHRQASTRAIMLIAALLTFLILFYSLPYSQVNYDQRVSLYNNGAEGVVNINLFDYSNITFIHEIINNLTTLLQENFSSSLDGFSPFIVASNHMDANTPTFTFINTSTFGKASAIGQFNPELRFGLEKDLKTLHTVPGSLIIDQTSFNSMFLKINDTVTIRNGTSGYVNLPVIDDFKMWPATSNYYYSGNMYAITDIANIFNSNKTDISGTVYSQIQSVGIYLNFKDGVNITKVANEISNSLLISVQTSNFQPQSWNVYQKLIFQFQLGQINTNVIMSVVIGIIILIMFAYMQMNDRRNEIYTERALGMKLRQTGVLFFIEEILLLFTGMVIGTVLGTYFISMIAIFQTRGSQIPSYDILIPWNLVAITYLGLLILAVFSALIPAIYVTKQEISKSFGGN